MTIEKTRKLFDDWIHHSFPMSIKQLGLFRVCFCLYMIFIYGIPNFSFLSDNPSYIFSPPTLSFVALFEDFPNSYFFIAQSFLLYVLFTLLLFGYKTKPVSLAIGLILMVCYSFHYSFGKIDHHILIVILPIVMAFSSWGASFTISPDKSKEPECSASNWPVTLMALLLGFAMFSAGVPKLFTGWLDVSSNAVNGHFYHNYYVSDRKELLASLFITINHPFFWEALDYTAVFFELGFLFAALKPNWFRFFVFLAVIFHLINLVIFNISFISHIPIYLLFINWNLFEERLFLKPIALKINACFTFRNMFALLFLSIAFWGYTSIYEPIPLWDNPSPIKIIFIKLGFEKLTFHLFILISAIAFGVVQVLHFISKR